jgi:hypothetical protein
LDPTPAPPPAAAKSAPTPGEITIMIGAVVVLIASFLPFYEASEEGFDLDWSAWSNAWSLFPLAPLMVLAALAAGAAVAATRFGNVNLPATVLGFTLKQELLVLTFLPMLTFLAYILRGTEGLDTAMGGYLALLGSIAAYVGAILISREGTAS